MTLSKNQKPKITEMIANVGFLIVLIFVMIGILFSDPRAELGLQILIAMWAVSSIWQNGVNSLLDYFSK